MTFYAEAVLTKGGLRFRSPASTFRAMFRFFWRKGKDEEEMPVTVAVYRGNRRTEAQNRRYWAIVTLIANYVGEPEPEDIHEVLKLRLNPKKVLIADPKTGEIIDDVTIGGSTRNMTIPRFADYMTAAEALAAELGVNIEGELEQW
jgi:hypothetical protein